MSKLKEEQKHIIRLIARDSATDGSCKVSAQLYSVLESNMPKELVSFVKNEDGTGFAKLTPIGKNVFSAMEWL